MFELIPLAEISTEETIKLNIPQELVELKNNPFPWTSYIARNDSGYTGVCAFKFPPDSSNITEIAYMVFPGYEGKGHGTQIARKLLKIAIDTKEKITVLAHTLPYKTASSSICEKAGFQFAGEVEDPEDGKVWRWVYQL